MANIVAVTRVLEGRHSTFHVYMRSDGVAGELVDQVIIDPVADLGLTSAERMAIEKIQYSLFGFQARIEFDTGLVEDKMLWVLHGTDTVDFQSESGLKDRSSALDGTGKLLISTNGFTSTDDEGSFYIKVRV